MAVGPEAHGAIDTLPMDLGKAMDRLEGNIDGSTDFLMGYEVELMRFESKMSPVDQNGKLEKTPETIATQQLLLDTLNTGFKVNPKAASILGLS